MFNLDWEIELQFAGKVIDGACLSGRCEVLGNGDITDISLNATKGPRGFDIATSVDALDLGGPDFERTLAAQIKADYAHVIAEKFEEFYSHIPATRSDRKLKEAV
jgi:hypothetical protein